jgi:dTDP-glucose 4,6-dehydratase
MWKMTILVTGGCGFIGTNFIFNWFQQSDEHVVNVDCMTYAANTACLDRPPHKNLTNLNVNITNSQAISEIFNEHHPRAVIHFAAESHVDRSIASADQFITTNINGTYALLVNALNYLEGAGRDMANRFRFLHVSTDEVFGSLPTDASGFAETTAYRPNSPYSASKAASDHLVRCYYETFGVPSIVTNCSNNYGPYQHAEKFIPTVLNSFLEGKKIPVYGDGQQIRDWLFVGDHCDALMCVLENGVPGESYNIGGNCEKTNLELIACVYDELDRMYPGLLEQPLDDYISFVEDRLGHDRRYAIDASKIRKQLGWEPTHDFAGGILKTISWHREDLALAK